MVFLILFLFFFHYEHTLNTPFMPSFFIYITMKYFKIFKFFLTILFHLIYFFNLNYCFYFLNVKTIGNSFFFFLSPICPAARKIYNLFDYLSNESQIFFSNNQD